MKPITPSCRSFLVVLLLAFSLSCSQRQPGDPLTPGYNVYSRDQDVEIGKQAAAEIRQQVEIVDNPRLQSYVSNIGKRLAAQPEAEDYPYEFTLINEPSINAFALPGGPIFVHSGLISAADNEGQVAGVLGHEIAHVVLRHGTSQASKAQMIQLPAVLAGAILGSGGIAAQAGQIGLGLGLNALVMKYSRSAEKEADALGARIMAGAGYNPIEAARFFEKLAAEGGARPPILLSSHPDPGNRVRLVEAEMATFPPGDYGYSTGQFDDARGLVARLPPPKQPQQQQEMAAANSAPPSAPGGSYRRVDAGSFSIEAPQGWEAYGGRGSRAVTLAPQRGIVRGADGSASIGYGAVVSSFKPRYRTDLLNGTWELIQELQETNANLRVTGKPRYLNIGGSQGLIVGLSGRSPYGGAEREVLLSVARPEGIAYMVFVGPENGFAQLQPAFERMAQSIRFE